MLDQTLAKLAEDWPIFAPIFTLLILISAKLFQSRLVSFLPGTLQKYFDSRAKLEANKQEFERQAAIAEQQLKRLERMSELSSSTFIEQQVTQFTAEAQTQLQEANSFIRQSVSEKLDILIEGQRFILREIREVRRNGGKNGTKTIDSES